MERNHQISLGDDCYLDLDGAMVYKDGMPVYLSPTSFRLLLYLAEHMGEVISGEDLFLRGWGKDTMAQRDELYIYIRKLRIELEEDPDHPLCLITVRRCGYVLYPRHKLNKEE